MDCSAENRSYGEALICPLCFGLFVDPVLVVCECNFCCSDIVSDRKVQGGSVCCSHCSEDAAELTLQPNRVLRNVLDKIHRLTVPQEVTEEERRLCQEHQEKLTLICETDGMFICPVCRDSKLHKQHKFRERIEFIATCKNKGVAFLNSLNQKVVSLKVVLQKQGLEILQTEEMGCNLIFHVTQQFADLHQFLNDQEQWLMEKLEAQVESNLTGMERYLTEMHTILFSSELDITNIEVKLDQSDLTVLKEVSSWRDSRFSEEMPTAMSGNVCLGTYKGPLQYKRWGEMKEIIHQVPLTISLTVTGRNLMGGFKHGVPGKMVMDLGGDNMFEDFGEEREFGDDAQKCRVDDPTRPSPEFPSITDASLQSIRFTRHDREMAEGTGYCNGYGP
ncbi:nuclear factor 7, ovary-like [Heterodontus francisci]|uniref:nuclear factor 7, ovary-like n=1 Tax=Heterodontus francisci TaxID=7792 RepID=UPI00355C54A3